MGDRFCLVEAVNVNKAFLVKCKMGTFDQNAFGRQILEKKDFTIEWVLFRKSDDIKTAGGCCFEE